MHASNPSPSLFDSISIPILSSAFYILLPSFNAQPATVTVQCKAKQFIQLIKRNLMTCYHYQYLALRPLLLMLLLPCLPCTLFSSTVQYALFGQLNHTTLVCRLFSSKLHVWLIVRLLHATENNPFTSFISYRQLSFSSSIQILSFISSLLYICSLFFSSFLAHSQPCSWSSPS